MELDGQKRKHEKKLTTTCNEKRLDKSEREIPETEGQMKRTKEGKIRKKIKMAKKRIMKLKKSENVQNMGEIIKNERKKSERKIQETEQK